MSGFVCRRMPIGLSRRTASSSAARERSRPMASGATRPGNTTALRTGRMMTASSGSGRDGAWPRGAFPAAGESTLWAASSLMSFSIPWRCGPQGGVSSPDHGDVLGAAFGEPDLAGASQDLAHVGAAARQGEALELLARGIEAEDRVAGPLAGPHLVAVVHVDGIGVRVVGGRLVRAPLLLRRVV